MCVCVIGSFSVQYEDMDSSKSWEGVVQYTMTAILIGPDPAANRRLTVSNTLAPLSTNIVYTTSNYLICDLSDVHGSFVGVIV